METTVSRAGAREWLGLAVLAFPTLLLGMDATVLYLAMPRLAADLRPTDTEMLWIVDSYGFLIAGFLVTMGTLGDRIGRRKLLMIGGTAFAAASVLAAFAPDPLLLILARGLLGVAGATLGPSTLALISTMFPAAQRGTAIALWATCFSAGIAVGPIVGGLLLEWFWWGAVFLLAVPFMAVLVLSAPALLPEFRDTEAGKLDLTSVFLALAAVLPVIYGIKQHGGVAGSIAIVAGLGFGVLFVARQRKLTHPLLDLRMFGSHSFSVALMTQLFTMTAIGGVYLFVTQYMQLVQDFSPFVAGLWLMPSALVLVVSSMATPKLTSRFAPGYVVGVALMLAAIGFAVLALAAGLAAVVAGFSLLYLGVGPIMALGTDLVIGTAPPEKAGSAAAMSETAMEFGIALGVGVLGVIGTAVATDGQPLLEATATRFTAGLNVVALICAVVTALLSVLVLRLLSPRAKAIGSDDAIRTDHVSVRPPGRR
ncbi:MFS transporter [Kibdelosporangium phytohabitans]|uniref:MFS transporter n=1 Tax=Kibdelosporangium phytohabitans TaxID=860235 RepID=A0A0N9HWF8_9PSEU|nr:MFS transporter [Kibdelosporangium phytohabitans]ALG06162.1 MFS transporter [Kibdelosporangium phytohabitans]MBE1465743.1 DHA2 family multidrug resistance protein-like MFS transporter [Kibdelosporangium phytohabitans]